MAKIDTSRIPKRFDTATLEAEWRRRWDDPEISLPCNGENLKTFVIDSPPPTVSGALHVGHIFSYTHQDLYARYKRMRGFRVVYPMGWDDNGLPTERRVQNLLSVRAEPDIPYIEDLDLETERSRQRLRSDQQLVLSRRNFIELCEQVTKRDEIAFKQLFLRMGYSICWTEEYSTIDGKSRRIAQRSFLDLFKNGHVYQQESPTMWDVDFRTAVAQAEVEERIKPSAYFDLEFQVAECRSDSCFTVSTTRPELLAACVGVAAHPDDIRYRKFFGKRAITPVYFNLVPIFPSADVDRKKGTGIVMVCTFGDQYDVQWWRDHHLESRQILAMDGRVLRRTFGGKGWFSLRADQANSNFEPMIGKDVLEARRIVAEQLSDPINSVNGRRSPLRGSPKRINHPVRFYEKGESPLEYLTTRQWFVRLLDKKERLLALGNEIGWHPDFMRKRYRNWTENLSSDWCISRQRYFGVPIPIWYPVDNNGDVVFDQPIVASEDMLPVDPDISPPPGYSLEQSNRPGGYKPELDVFDTWFTSSMTPQIVAGWGEGTNDRMKDLFPADIRPQSHEIIRTWAFYTIAKSMLHNDTFPWKNVVISGWVLDPDRKKMSKSRGAAATPTDMLDRFGADAVRYWSASAQLGTDTTPDESMFKIGTRLVNKIYNAGKFVLSQNAEEGQISSELDRCFVFELKKAVGQATVAFEQFQFSSALAITERFFWRSFTDNYIELVKRRARDEVDIEGQTSAVTCLRVSLSVLLRMFAPVLPTIVEEVWSWAFAAEKRLLSIHQAKWPTADEITSLPPVNSHSFKAACDAMAAVRKAKSMAGISVNHPLKSLTLIASEKGRINLRDVLDDVAASACVTSVSLFSGENPNQSSRYVAMIDFDEVRKTD